MSAEPQENKSEKLPFEPASSKKKAAKPTSSGTQTANAKSVQSSAATRDAQAIPQVVSQRMARRMAFFCGVPTLFGMLSFVVSYYLVTQLHYKIPSTVVLLASLGFFGLGVLGLTYGIFSASWDESNPGTLLGIEEFGTNFSRMTQARKEARQAAKPRN